MITKAPNFRFFYKFYIGYPTNIICIEVYAFDNPIYVDKVAPADYVISSQLICEASIGFRLDYPIQLLPYLD